MSTFKEIFLFLAHIRHFWGVIISTNFVGAHSKNKDSREERTLLIEIIIVGHFFGIYVFKKEILF